MNSEDWKGRILIVDDSSSVLDILRNALEYQGYTIYVATNGEKALLRASQSMPDLIILDVIMPGMDGFETCRLLKDDEKTGDIPVIFMTGLADTAHKVRGFEVGGVDYIAKPIEINELVARVALHLSLHSMQEQLKTQNKHLQKEINERRRVEEEIRILNTELEQRVEERTAELRKINEQLKEEIEERIHAEEALRESEERYRIAIEGANDGVAIIKEGRHIYVNKQFLNMFGYDSIDDLKGKLPYSKTVHPDDYARVKKFIKDRKNGGETPVRYEFKGIKKDGNAIYIEVSLTTITYKGEKAILTFHRDVTDRKMAEYSIRESEERFHQLFEQNEDALMLFKEGTTEIIDINPAAVTLYNYPKEAFIAKDPSFLFDPDDFQVFKNALLSIKKNRTFTIENMIIHGKDAKNINVSIRGQIMKLQQQDVIYCNIRDITEKIRMEKETAIMQSKLIFANRMSSLGVLVSSVAHEINNPNNFILFNSSILSDAWRDATSILDEYQQERGDFSLAGLAYSEMREAVGKLLEGVTGGSQRIRMIVNNLKDFVRQDPAGLEGIVVINKVIAASVTMLNHQIKKYTRNFHAEYGSNLPEIRGNSQQLEQVIVNLLMNALEALPSRDAGIKITTSYNSLVKEIVVTISDEGTGISVDILDKIAEPFFTTKSETGGTGLGIPISYSIIRDHEGFLEFQSGKGMGTQTFIRLPVQENKKGSDI